MVFRRFYSTKFYITFFHIYCIFFHGLCYNHFVLKYTIKKRWNLLCGLLLIILIVLVIAVIALYNDLVSLRQRVKMLGVKLMYNYKEDLI